MSFHDWIPLRVSRVVGAPSRPVERVPVVSLTGDRETVRVEHRASWGPEAVVYHFGVEAMRWSP